MLRPRGNNTDLPILSKRIAASLFLSMFLLSVCAPAMPVPKSTFPELDARRYPVIGVRMRQSNNPPAFKPPLAEGEAVAYGAGAGASGIAQGCAGTGDPMGVILCLAALPITAVVGALASGSQARSKQTIVMATEALKKALVESKPDLGVQDALIQRLRGAGFKEIRPLIEDEYQLSMDDLAKRGIDGIVEIELSRLDLAVYGRVNPEVMVVLRSRFEFRGTREPEARPPYSWSYLGKRQNYFRLAANNAALLRHEIEAAYKGLADFIIAETSFAQKPV